MKRNDAGTGEGSEPLKRFHHNGYWLVLADEHEAQLAMCRDSLKAVQDRQAPLLESLAALRSQLEEARKLQTGLEIALNQERRDLASAQARIARLEQALRQVNHLQHSLAIEQDGTGNMRIEYWTREIEDVVCNALNPAEPQSGEK